MIDGNFFFSLSHEEECRGQTLLCTCARCCIEATAPQNGDHNSKRPFLRQKPPFLRSAAANAPQFVPNHFFLHCHMWESDAEEFVRMVSVGGNTPVCGVFSRKAAKMRGRVLVGH